MAKAEEEKKEVAKIDVPFITLKDEKKTKLPLISLGLYKIEAKDMKRVLKCAFDAGYRHFDCASVYGNEGAFGEAFSALNIERESVLITSKVWNDMQGYDNTIKSCLRSLEDCQLKYFDFYLPHWPLKKTHIETYRALIQLKKDKKIRFIGLSNYYQNDYETLKKEFEKKKEAFDEPLMNQIWINPMFYDKDKINYFAAQSIAVTGYKPLQRGDKRLLQNQIVIKLAQKYGMTAAQVCIKWCVQKGCVAVVKSAHNERIIENIQSLAFKDFADDDLKLLESLTTAQTLKEMYDRYLWRMSLTKLVE
eukprot:58304_1